MVSKAKRVKSPHTSISSSANHFQRLISWEHPTKMAWGTKAGMRIFCASFQFCSEVVFFWEWNPKSFFSCWFDWLGASPINEETMIKIRHIWWYLSFSSVWRMFSCFNVDRSKLRWTTKGKFRHDEWLVFGRKLQRRDFSVRFCVNKEKRRSFCLSQLIEMSIEKRCHSTLFPNGNQSISSLIGGGKGKEFSRNLECRRTARGKLNIFRLQRCSVNLSKSLCPEWNEKDLMGESFVGVVDSNHDCSIFVRRVFRHL